MAIYSSFMLIHSLKIVIFPYIVMLVYQRAYILLYIYICIYVCTHVHAYYISYIIHRYTYTYMHITIYLWSWFFVEILHILQQLTWDSRLRARFNVFRAVEMARFFFPGRSVPNPNWRNIYLQVLLYFEQMIFSVSLHLQVETSCLNSYSSIRHLAYEKWYLHIHNLDWSFNDFVMNRLQT